MLLLVVNRKIASSRLWVIRPLSGPAENHDVETEPDGARSLDNALMPLVI